MAAARLPLLLLPGLVCDERVYAQVRSWLADVADPVVVDLTGADTMAALADNVLANAPERFALAGLSMGGLLRARDRAPRAAAGRCAGAHRHLGAARYARVAREPRAADRARARRRVRRRDRRAAAEVGAPLARGRRRGGGRRPGHGARRRRGHVRAPAAGDHEPRRQPAAAGGDPLPRDRDLRGGRRDHAARHPRGAARRHRRREARTSCPSAATSRRSSVRRRCGRCLVGLVQSLG